MERKFYEKYTSLKVPLARFFLAPFLSSRPQRIDAANTFFPGWIHCRIAEAEAAGRGVGAEAGGGAQGALRW